MCVSGGDGAGGGAGGGSEVMIMLCCTRRGYRTISVVGFLLSPCGIWGLKLKGLEALPLSLIYSPGRSWILLSRMTLNSWPFSTFCVEIFGVYHLASELWIETRAWCLQGKCSTWAPSLHHYLEISLEWGSVYWKFSAHYVLPDNIVCCWCWLIKGLRCLG